MYATWIKAYYFLFSVSDQSDSSSSEDSDVVSSQCDDDVPTEKGRQYFVMINQQIMVTERLLHFTSYDFEAISCEFVCVQNTCIMRVDIVLKVT